MLVRQRRVLIVIDNAEHMLYEVANFVRRLLKADPGIRVIVTSREPLHVGGEHVLRLGGIEESEQLFLDRARNLRADVTLSRPCSLVEMKMFLPDLLSGVSLSMKNTRVPLADS